MVSAVESKPASISIVAQMDKLFEIDERRVNNAYGQEDRHALRLQKAQPLLEEIRSQIEVVRSAALPKSMLAKACNYTLTLWRQLTHFLEYPELELSNNSAEKRSVLSRLDVKIGSTLAARKPDHGSQLLSRLAKLAGD
jgi:transposase